MLSLSELRESASEILAGLAFAAALIYRARLKVKEDNRGERAATSAERVYQEAIAQLTETVERMGTQLEEMDRRITEEMTKRHAVELEADRLRRRVAVLEYQLGLDPGAAARGQGVTP